MQYWLMKSEPSTYSIDTLLDKPNHTDDWEGVRNYQARNFMIQMQPGDKAFFYHSSCPNPGIVGTLDIIRAHRPDYSALDPATQYYDPKSTRDNPRWVMVTVQATEKFKNIISLATLKKEATLQEMIILKRGNRLSITPVTLEEWAYIMHLARSS